MRYSFLPYSLDYVGLIRRFHVKLKKDGRQKVDTIFFSCENLASYWLAILPIETTKWTLLLFLGLLGLFSQLFPAGARRNSRIFLNQMIFDGAMAERHSSIHKLNFAAV